jgi:hypothetical protein
MVSLSYKGRQSDASGHRFESSLASHSFSWFGQTLCAKISSAEQKLVTASDPTTDNMSHKGTPVVSIAQG